DLGLDVIVCDHHHAPTRRPPVLALLNPLQPGCAFPFKGLSGAGVVFYLLMGLRAELRARGHDRLPDLRRYLDLVALGTVADELEMHNAERRALEDAMVAEAVSAIEARRDPHARTIVVAREGWHPGVVGIVAARLAERFHRPALAIALEGATARGSGRSVRG